MTPTVASISDWPPELSTLLTFLANDDRPTIVLKLPLESTSKRYYNNALSRFLTTTTISEIGFESWVGQLSLHDTALHDAGQYRKAGRFGGGDWSISSLGSLYITVSCQTELHLDGHSEASNGHKSPNSSISSRLGDDDDYLLRIPQLAGDPYAIFFTQYAWHETVLGPIRDWHPVLREHVATMLVCPNPRVGYWGSALYQLYNEAAVPMMKAMHPICLGRSLTDIWGQNISDQVTSTFSYKSLDLKSMPVTDVEHIIERDGYTEEVYFTYTTLPFCDFDGTVLGHMLELAETTNTVLMRERATGKNKAMEIAEAMNSPEEVWQHVKAFLQPDTIKDVCYAILFSNTETRRPLSQASDPSQLNSRYTLQHQFGIPDHEGFCKLPELLASTLNLDPAKHKKIVILQTQSDTLPQSLAVNVPDRGVVNTVCLFPLLDNNGHPLGFAVLGMNPRRRFDDDSRLFIQSTRDVFARRTELLSRPDKDRTNDMVHMYREAPIGLYKLRLDGHPVFINDKYLELMGLRREDYYGPSGNFAWADALFEEDRETILAAWETLIAGGSGAWEFRTKAHGPQVWLESRAFIELDDNNNPISVYGWLSDVSHRKLTEKLMANRLSDALETKNAAIQFIDIVSHEMRNPLSSILQLTDSILTTIKPLADNLPDFAANSIIDAADTINLCAQHQKTIVDDILTLSKLDSKLVVLSPDVVQVRQILKKVMRMVEVDLERCKIDTAIQIDQSCTDIGVDYVSLDSGRLLQILLNLLTNAIKFTQHQIKTRRIQIALSALRERPDGKTIGVEYIEPRNQGNMQNPSGTELDSPEEMWLQFSVADTGLGMTEEETTHLFYRFSQASPKTYKQYGGSGLGLFICRELAELHGGRIGFHSEYGMGTKFAFYIKAKRAHPPPPSVDHNTPGQIEKPVNTSIKNLHILIVEDNAINQRVMAQQLRKTGCSVDVADNGEEALDYLASTVALLAAPDALPISIILMDIEMPVMDGLTCTRKIREMEAAGEIRTHLPIAGITANSRQEQIIMAQAAGMDDVITKPFRISDIVPRIEALAAKWPFPV